MVRGNDKQSVGKPRLQPRGDALIPVNSYRIPLLLYAQGLQPRRFDGLASSMSLPKTLVSLLGIRTSEAFGGADLLCDCDTVVPVEFGYHIGLLERDALHVVRADGGYANWSYDLPGNRLGPVNDVVDPAARRRVIDTFAPAYQWFHAR